MENQNKKIIEEDKCAICYDNHNDQFVKLKCGHLLHTPCFKKMTREVNGGFINCPLCRVKDIDDLDNISVTNAPVPTAPAVPAVPVPVIAPVTAAVSPVNTHEQQQQPRSTMVIYKEKFTCRELCSMHKYNLVICPAILALSLWGILITNPNGPSTYEYITENDIATLINATIGNVTYSNDKTDVTYEYIINGLNDTDEFTVSLSNTDVENIYLDDNTVHYTDVESYISKNSILTDSTNTFYRLNNEKHILFSEANTNSFLEDAVDNAQFGSKTAYAFGIFGSIVSLLFILSVFHEFLMICFDNMFKK